MGWNLSQAHALSTPSSNGSLGPRNAGTGLPVEVTVAAAAYTLSNFRWKSVHHSVSASSSQHFAAEAGGCQFPLHHSYSHHRRPRCNVGAGHSHCALFLAAPLPPKSSSCGLLARLQLSPAPGRLISSQSALRIALGEATQAACEPYASDRRRGATAATHPARGICLGSAPAVSAPVTAATSPA